MAGPDDLAITALEAASSLATTFAGRFYADEAPAALAFPFVVVQLMPGTTTFESGHAGSGGPSGTDESELQVSVFATTRSSLKTLSAAVETVLTDLSDGTMLFFRRVNQTVSIDPSKGPGGVDVWRSLLVFRTIQEMQ